MEIKIPFMEYMKQKVASGEKKGTTRTKKYGNVGDVFDIWYKDLHCCQDWHMVEIGETFELTEVKETTLIWVALNKYKQEGFKSTMEFVGYWMDIHKRKGFDPGQVVWYHEFKKVKENENKVSERQVC